MQLINTALLGLLASTASASGMRKHRAWHEKRASLLPNRPAAKAASLARRDDPTPYLTDKTRKFAVNGSALPDVDFDIGESYAGSLPIDTASNRTLWFWFVPTTNPDAKDEITIWLNGGPGCSSLDGFFHENGPVIWQPGTYKPVRNEWAYSNLTNTVWIDQPVGTGFAQGVPNATSEVDVADQFRGFWKNFVDTFDLHKRDVYLTGESYAGQYIPWIADGMLNQTDDEYFKVKGIQIYDPSIGYDSITEQAPTAAFIDWTSSLWPLNDTAKATIANMSRDCGYDDFMAKGMQFPPSGPLPPQPGVNATGQTRDECDIFDYAIAAITAVNPCWNIYQVGQLCPIPWDVLGFPYSDFYLPPGYGEPYFNMTAVKQAVNAPLDVDWAICSAEDVFVGPKGDLSLPSAVGDGPLKRVVEKTNNVIVGHGSLDMVLFLNGSLLTLQNLTWNGAQGLSAPPTKPFYVPYHNDTALSTAAGAGVFGAWQEDRGLTFVSIALSGHEVPQFQPSAAYRILELMLGRIDALDQGGAFTTRPDEADLNPQRPLGMGTAPLAV